MALYNYIINSIQLLMIGGSTQLLLPKGCNIGVSSSGFLSYGTPCELQSELLVSRLATPKNSPTESPI